MGFAGERVTENGVSALGRLPRRSGGQAALVIALVSRAGPGGGTPLRTR